MPPKVYLAAAAAPELEAECRILAGLCPEARFEPLAEAELSAPGLRDKLLEDSDFLGLLSFGADAGTDLLRICDDLSGPAQASATIDAMVRHADKRLFGDWTLAGAIAGLLRSEGIGAVRTALILGGGELTRATVAALRELGCARYLIGFHNPAHLQTLGSRLRSFRQPIAFFQLTEMAQFFEWAEGAGVFASGHVPPTESGGAERAVDSGAKRWELLVNTAATERLLFQPATPLANHNFLSSVNRVLDLNAGNEESELVRQARSLGIPAFTGARLLEVRRQHFVQLLRRTLSGEELAAVQAERRRRQRYVLRRRG